MTTYNHLSHYFQISNSDTPKDCNEHKDGKAEINILDYIKTAANQITLYNLPDVPGSVMVCYVLQYAGFQSVTTEINSLKKFCKAGEGAEITIWTKNASNVDAFLEIDGIFLANGINDNGGPGLINVYDFNPREYTPLHLINHADKPKHLCRKTC